MADAMSERVLRAVAPFGETVPRGLPSGDRGAAVRRVLDGLRERPVVVLITGPSGAGKTTLVAEIERALGASSGIAGEVAVRADRLRVPGDRPVAALAPSVPLDDWLGCLGLAGLAEARLFATRARDLSVGESARLRLALAFARLRGAARPCLVCDEFASVLDRDTAAGVGSALRRWATRRGARVVVATAHADMVRLLGPDTVVRLDPAGGDSVSAGPGRARGGRVRIEPGSASDVRSLARFHYRRARPASVCGVWRAVVSGAEGPRVAGVLIVSFPTLNGAWRETAWPGRYVSTLPERARSARRLNREVRRISRVIVDPRDRGRGIATALVRAYLADPLTPATEAVSAMGRFSPFTASAGMTVYPLPLRPADDRLADMLDAMGLAPWQLMDPERIASVRASRDGAFLERELRAWATQVRSSVPKPRRDPADVWTLAPLAAARLCAPPAAAVHVR
jgi:ABC-type ATPase involved in cell division/GNAT superfamily N-acetyltransferase